MFKKQQLIFEELKKECSNKFSNNVIVVKGNAGVGKTYIIKQLIQEFDNTTHMPVCYISGDQFCQERDYYCIKQSLLEISEKYEKKKNDKELISEFVGEMPYVGDISKKIISDKLNYADVDQDRKNFFLDNDEKNIVYRLNYLLGKKHSLIICDNFQYFDKKSLEIIYIFLRNASKFEFMQKCQFLLIITEESNNNSANKIIEEFSKVQYVLEQITIKEMDEYLVKHKLNLNIDSKIRNVLYKLSNGHLEVIKQIALKINSQSSYGYNNENLENVLEHLITESLERLGDKGKELAILLEYASLVGNKFLNYEIEKSCNINKQEYNNLIKYSQAMDYVIQDNLYAYFSHDIIQVVFRNKAYSNNFSFYNRMKECVKELFPGDYVRRIQIELELENRYDASILIIQYFFRHNFQSSYERKDYLKILAESVIINNFYTYIKDAVKLYSGGNYIEAVKQLNFIDNSYPIQLLAIRDILKSVSLTKLIGNKPRLEAVQCLENYTLESLNREGDLYLQILLAQISSYSHNGNIELVKKSEKNIYEYIAPRFSYDEKAKTIFYIIKRISNCMHECLIAERMIKESVDYFKPLPGNVSALNPYQYLMSLTNHSGILIECGRFNDALKETETAYNFIQKNAVIAFPRPQILDNNFLLAVYLEKNSLKKEVLKSYEKLLSLGENADNIFIFSNYCALLAINGHTDKAYTLLIEKQNQALNNNEHFYEISIQNNLLILEIFNKNYSNAQSILNNLKEKTDGIIDESYYAQKHELLQYAIDQTIDLSIDKIDTFLFDYCETYQEAWAYWGHSFDFTSLYYWSDL